MEKAGPCTEGKKKCCYLVLAHLPCEEIKNKLDFFLKREPFEFPIKRGRNAQFFLCGNRNSHNMESSRCINKSQSYPLLNTFAVLWPRFFPNKMTTKTHVADPTGASF